MARRIALLLHADEAGGAERSLVTLARTLAARSVETDLVLLTGGEPRRETVPDGVRLVRLGARRVSTSIRPLTRYLSRERPQAVLGVLTHVNLAALAARRLSRVPTRLVLSEHTLLSQLGVAAHRHRDRVSPWLASWFYGRADAVVCVSEGLADDVARRTGLDRTRIEVIPTPVSRADLLAAANGPPPHAWFEDEPPVVLAVGRLERVKAFDHLLAALALVREHVPARLVILGEGRERSRLESEARRLRLNGEVLMPGFQQNPYRWMARADVVALSSIREASPTVLVEALALSRPVVATDCDVGPREVLADGRFGRLVPPGDDGALADAIAQAIVNGAQPVPSDALERYAPERVADRYLELLLP
jgi:glycosyltransferase involved in cell wall biosynthesis